MDPQPDHDIDQEIRINELRETARELAGGEMVEFESPDCSGDHAEAFWNHVAAYEKAPWTSEAERLQKTGIELPLAESMSDEQLTAKLWEVIHALARKRTFLYSTDHLSDRELYIYLVEDVLHDRIKLMGDEDDPMFEGCYNIDLVSSGSEEDIELHLRYYASEVDRRDWLEQFPEDHIPPHQTPPYDRDSRLPQHP